MANKRSDLKQLTDLLENTLQTLQKIEEPDMITNQEIGVYKRTHDLAINLSKAQSGGDFENILKDLMDFTQVVNELKNRKMLSSKVYFEISPILKSLRETTRKRMKIEASKDHPGLVRKLRSSEPVTKIGQKLKSEAIIGGGLAAAGGVLGIPALMIAGKWIGDKISQVKEERKQRLDKLNDLVEKFSSEQEKESTKSLTEAKQTIKVAEELEENRRKLTEEHKRKISVALTGKKKRVGIFKSLTEDRTRPLPFIGADEDQPVDMTRPFLPKVEEEREETQRPIVEELEEQTNYLIQISEDMTGLKNIMIDRFKLDQEVNNEEAIRRRDKVQEKIAENLKNLKGVGDAAKIIKKDDGGFGVEELIGLSAFKGLLMKGKGLFAKFFGTALGKGIAIAAAGFAGWKIGRFLGEQLGIDKAVQSFVDEKLERREFERRKKFLEEGGGRRRIVVKVEAAKRILEKREGRRLRLEDAMIQIWEDPKLRRLVARSPAEIRWLKERVRRARVIKEKQAKKRGIKIASEVKKREEKPTVGVTQPVQEKVTSTQIKPAGSEVKTKKETIPTDSSKAMRELEGAPKPEGKVTKEKPWKERGNVNTENLNPAVRENLKSMAEEYTALTGKVLPLNAAWRSTQHQKRLYDTMPPGKAAPPGSSMHEYGLAWDSDTSHINRLASLGLMEKYGFTRPIRKETWHAEPSGINRRAIKQEGRKKYALAKKQVIPKVTIPKIETSMPKTSISKIRGEKEGIPQTIKETGGKTVLAQREATVPITEQQKIIQIEKDQNLATTIANVVGDAQQRGNNIIANETHNTVMPPDMSYSIDDLSILSKSKNLLVS